MRDVLESLNYRLLDNIKADLPIWMIVITKRVSPTLSLPIEEQIAIVEAGLKDRLMNQEGSSKASWLNPLLL